MGAVIHQYISPYSFMMGVMWFNTFVFLGWLLRKMKFPVRFSVVPLLLILVLSALRMFVVLRMPGAVVIHSGTLYPAIINLLRHDIVPLTVFGLPINVGNVFICVWAIGAVWLVTRYFYDYICKFNPVMNWFETSNRDRYAETLLADMIGYDKHFRVYRDGGFSTPVATAIKPYIILPKADFSEEQLRVVLLHEWKHIQDKDYLTLIIVNLICFVFWWNPLVYILRKNFRFAQELKCDWFAVSDKNDLIHFITGLILLVTLRNEKKKKYAEYEGFNAFIGKNGGLKDRVDALTARNMSRGKRISTNVGYSIVIFALFFASYTFIILPAFWESPYDAVPVEDFLEERGAGNVVRPEENFLVDNDDGTFSHYIDGVFVVYVYETSELINWIPIRVREDQFAVPLYN